MRPNASTARSTIRRQSAKDETSASTARASPPSSATVAFRASSPRAATTTFAPRRAARRAIARPSPAEPPVTTTTCSSSGFLAIREGSCPPWRTAETLLGWAYAEHQRTRDHPAAARRPPPLRSEAPAGDRPVARERDARVQGLSLGQHEAGGDADVAATRGHAGHHGARARPRERNRLLAPRPRAPAPAPPRGRWGGVARRASRGAAAAAVRLHRRGLRRLHRRLHLPP